MSQNSNTTPTPAIGPLMSGSERRLVLGSSECPGPTHYAGCVCHEKGWQNKWECAVEMAAREELERDELRRTNEGLQLLFNLRWKADQRAIKRWQAAHPGNELTWPDHADMVVWLLEQSSENAEPIRSGGGETPSADRTPESP